MTPRSRLLAWVAATCASLVLAQVLPAATPPAPQPAPSDAAAVPTSQSPALTAEDLAVFFDGLVPFALRRDDVAGGVITVVKGGQVLFARGYGMADLKSHSPMSAQDTVVRPGSISKLFTWTAVMQLVEQGKVDLDHDINEYLDFKIPDYEGRPVTLRNLLTHTGGFEEVARGLLPKDPAEVNLERYLKTHVPARIFPAGEVVAYSNYGCGLAGYIVQRLSGESFEDYIAHHIFEPLKMGHSTFKQPVPAALDPLLSKGYKSVSDGVAQPFEYVNPAPAGSLSTTAMDMTQFMIAHLHGGAIGETQILKPETARLMHSSQSTPVPGLPGFALGFYEEDRNGQRIIGHGGDTVFFHSDLHLLMDKDVGIFMSFNSAGSAAGGSHLVRRAVFDAFMDRYFPSPTEEPATAPTAKADGQRVAGYYLASRRNESAVRWLYFMIQTKVTSDAEGIVTVSDFRDYAGNPIRWREVGPLRYREVGGSQVLDFVAGPDGSIRYIATNYIPAIEIFQRVPGYKSLSQAGLWFLLSFALLLGTLVAWPVSAWVRRHYGKTLGLAPEVSRTRLLSRIGALLLGVSLLAWLVLLMVTVQDESVLLGPSIVSSLYALYALGVVGLLGALAVLVHSVRSFHVGSRSIVVRIGEGLLGLSVIYLVWFMATFGLLSFSIRF